MSFILELSFTSNYFRQSYDQFRRPAPCRHQPLVAASCSWKLMEALWNISGRWRCCCSRYPLPPKLVICRQNKLLVFHKSMNDVHAALIHARVTSDLLPFRPDTEWSQIYCYLKSFFNKADCKLQLLFSSWIISCQFHFGTTQVLFLVPGL